MYHEPDIPEPFVFNPLKHHLGYIRRFVYSGCEAGRDTAGILKELRHIGSSVMDVYTGTIEPVTLLGEITRYLGQEGKLSRDAFAGWAGPDPDDFKLATISDNSTWTLKFHDNGRRFIHVFPARSGPRSFRIKANTIKTAILYYIFIGRDYITSADLNRARSLLGLSPVKDPAETRAITAMIEILRA
jgi:hypothetical protein